MNKSEFRVIRNVSGIIKCKGAFAMETCGKPAEVVETVEWDTGRRSGASFFYFCHECLRRNLDNRERRTNSFV